MTRPTLPPDTEWISPGYMGEAEWSPDAVLVAPGARPPSPLEATPSAQIAAAGEPLTGAMIALVPADPDSLAVEGGEPADQLHLTLLYLGDADTWPGEARTTLRQQVGALFRGFGNVEAAAFGVDYWNPGGEAPSWVLAVGDGPDQFGRLGDAHEVAEGAVYGAETQTLVPDQHTPWVAHICLLYGNVLPHASPGGAAPAEAGSAHPRPGNAGGRVPHLGSDPIEGPTHGGDSRTAPGHGNASRGGGSTWSSDSSDRGCAPLVPARALHQSAASDGPDDRAAPGSSRRAPAPGELFGPSDAIRGARPARVGNLPPVSPRGSTPMGGTQPRQAQGVPPVGSGQGGAGGEQQEISSYASLQGQGGATPAGAASGEILAQLLTRVGPVRFDKVRVAFGTEVFDVGLED